jgi:uncharacterized membrane protein
MHLVPPAANLLNNVNGLPTHALLVHFTVVVSTAAALGGLAYVVVPRFRRWLSYPLLALGAASIVLGLITPASGEKLEARVGHSALLEKHTELGDQMGTIMIAFGVLLIVAMIVVRYRESVGEHAVPATTPSLLDRLGGFPGRTLDRFSGQAPLAAVLTLLVLVGSIVSGVWIVRTGEAGARSVWDDTPAEPVAGAGEGR